MIKQYPWCNIDIIADDTYEGANKRKELCDVCINMSHPYDFWYKTNCELLSIGSCHWNICRGNGLVDSGIKIIDSNNIFCTLDSNGLPNSYNSNGLILPDYIIKFVWVNRGNAPFNVADYILGTNNPISKQTQKAWEDAINNCNTITAKPIDPLENIKLEITKLSPKKGDLIVWKQSNIGSEELKTMGLWIESNFAGVKIWNVQKEDATIDCLDEVKMNELGWVKKRPIGREFF